jgi:hypothetical protein
MSRKSNRVEAIHIIAWLVVVVGVVAAAGCASRRGSADSAPATCIPDLSRVADSVDLVVEARTLVFDSSLTVPAPYLELATQEIG